MRGGCGDPLCAVRIEIRRALPNDKGVAPPCDRCDIADRHGAEDWARVMRSVHNVIVGRL